MTAGSVMAEMPKYKCYKEVHALKIKAIEPDIDIAKREQRETDGGATIRPEEEGFDLFKVSREYLKKHDPQVGGYYVVYKDGYKSFSPAEAFEEGYTKIE